MTRYTSGNPVLPIKRISVQKAKQRWLGELPALWKCPTPFPKRRLEEKHALAAQMSSATYPFYLGATNDNLEGLLEVAPDNVCGIKVFQGSSTGNVVGDVAETLEEIFAE